MKKFIVTMVIIAMAVITGLVMFFNFKKSIIETTEAEVIKTDVYVLVEDVQGDVAMTANFGTPDAGHIIVREYKANGYTLTKELSDNKVTRVWIKKYRGVEIDVTSMIL